jgi:hypothetical protein
MNIDEKTNVKLLETVEWFLEKGKNLTIVEKNGKVPTVKDWPKKRLTRPYLISKVKQGYNIGWVIGDGDLVVDVDPRNGGTESFTRLSERFNFPVTRTVRTVQGGLHYYYSIPKGLKLEKELKEFKGVEFLTQGHKCMIAGSKALGSEYKIEQCSEIVEADERLIETLKKPDHSSVHENGQDDENDAFAGMNFNDIDEDKINELLDSLDPSMSYDDWLRVGMALHDWDVYRGLEIWESWSQSGDNYEAGETSKKWGSFSLNKGMGVGTLFFMAKSSNFDEKNKQVEKYRQDIKNASKGDLEIVIIPAIKKEKFMPIDLEVIVKDLQDRFKELDGVRLPIGKVRELVKEKKNEKDVPSWCQDWIYVDSHNRFINLRNLSLCRLETFNLKNTVYVPIGENGSKQTAAKFVAENGYLQTVDSIAYLPQKEDLIIQIEGKDVLNIFNHKSLPKTAKDFTNDGKDVIERIKRHISIVIGDEVNEKVFLQWLAYQVQYTGKKMLWSPVIQGTYGAGKSFFAELLRCCLGQTNVGTIAPTQISSQFNGWAVNKVVNVLEEIRVVGKSRHDIINALKPLITDPVIQINDKGVSQYTTYNTANYICFTNYKDAIPVDINDRRWWIIYSKLQTREDIENIEQEHGIDYFNVLFDSLKTYRAEIRKWLLEYEISEEFLNLKRAPMTEAKKTMAEFEELKTDGLQELKALIEEGGQYFNKNVVCSGDLFDAFILENETIDLSNQRKNLLLKKLGYSPSGQVKIDGKNRKVWTKKEFTNSEIREILR